MNNNFSIIKDSTEQNKQDNKRLVKKMFMMVAANLNHFDPLNKNFK